MSNNIGHLSVDSNLNRSCSVFLETAGYPRRGDTVEQLFLYAQQAGENITSTGPSYV